MGKRAEAKMSGSAPLATAMYEPRGSDGDKRSPEQQAGIDGIDFAREEDEEPEDPRTVAAPSTSPRTAESDRLNQQAAIAAMRELAAAPNVRTPVEIKPTPITPEEAARLEPKLYRVVGNHEVSRSASRFRLTAGKVICERDYDIPSLIAQGVTLTDYVPPGKAPAPAPAPVVDR